LPGSQRKQCATLLPQGQTCGISPIPVFFPTWYFALHCTASSSAWGEGQLAWWELREKEQKHSQGKTVWYQGMFRHKYAQLKAKHKKQVHRSPYKSQQVAPDNLAIRTDPGTQSRGSARQNQSLRVGDISAFPQLPERLQVRGHWRQDQEKRLSWRSTGAPKPPFQPSDGKHLLFQG